MKIESQQLILLHPGKTGGTSIEHTFRKEYLNNHKLDPKKEDLNLMFGYSKKHRLFLQHADLRFYKNILKIDLHKYKTITTVRNPYDRLVSCYYYNGKSKKCTFEDFVTQQLENHINANLSEGYSVNHFSPQTYFAKIDDYYVNHIIKLENFTDNLKEIGIDVSFHYSKTASRKGTFEDYYNSKTKDIVHQLYKEDFNYFNYLK